MLGVMMHDAFLLGEVDVKKWLDCIENHNRWIYRFEKSPIFLEQLILLKGFFTHNAVRL